MNDSMIDSFFHYVMFSSNSLYYELVQIHTVL